MGGSSKAQTVGYRYYAGVHMDFCHGPIDKLIEICVDKKTAWTGNSTGGEITINAPSLFGDDSREGGISGTLDFLPGGPAQGQSSYLVGILGALVPAFRETAGVVLKQMYLGLNPYLKQWSFRAQRIHKTDDGATQWYDEKAQINIGALTFAVDDVWKYYNDPLGTGDYSATGYDDSAWQVGEGMFGDDATGSPFPINTFIACTNVAQTLWIRRTVDFANPSALGDIHVNCYFDDIPTLYWNGSAVSITMDTTYTGHAVIPNNLINSSNAIAYKVRNTIMPHCHAGLAFSAPDAASFAAMNPAHILRECLTNSKWGMGYADEDIDDVSFEAGADTLYAEGMGMAILWDTQAAIEDFVDLVKKHIDAAVYVSRKTGKWTLKLIRNDYDVDDLITLDPSNVIKVTNFERAVVGELVTSVTVTYWNPTIKDKSTVTVADPALVQMQGNDNNFPVEYEGFPDGGLASRVAQRDLATLSAPLASCTVYANKTAKNLTIGDCFIFTWPKFQMSEVVMRITGIAYGDGKSNQIRIQCAQDVFDTPTSATISTTPPAWTNPIGDPAPITERVVFEVPYLEMVQREGQSTIDGLLASNPDAGFVAAGIVRPAGGGLNARLYTDNGSGFTDCGGIDFGPAAKLGEDIDLMATTFAITDPDLADSILLVTWFQMGTELMEIDAIDVDALTVTVKRGVLDTVPVAHTTGEIMIFWDQFAGADPVEYVASDEIDVKLLTVTGSGQLALGDAPTDTIVMDSRAIRPYPPGNLKINGTYFPADVSGDLVATYATRNRVQQTGSTLIGFTDGDVTTEVGVTYAWSIVGTVDAVEYASDDGITLSTFTIDAVDLATYPALLTITIWSERDTYESWQKYVVPFNNLNAEVDLEVDTSTLLEVDGTELLNLAGAY